MIAKKNSSKSAMVVSVSFGIDNVFSSYGLINNIRSVVLHRKTGDDYPMSIRDLENEDQDSEEDDDSSSDEETEESEERAETNEEPLSSTTSNPAPSTGSNLPIIIGAILVIGALFFFLPMGLFIILIPIVVIGLMSIRIVRPTERGAIERMGKYNRFATPGLNFLVPLVEKMILVNITERMVDAERQEIITKDNLNAIADAQIYFRVRPDELSVKAAIYAVNDFRIQTVALARTTLRNIIGTMEFKEVNSNRSRINSELMEELEKEMRSWGLEVVRTELKEITPPSDVQSTMNQVLIASNAKQAAIDFATAAETKADGERRAAVKAAEGQKQSAILVAEGQAKSIQLVNESANKYFTGNAVELKKLETMRDSLKDNTKVVVSSDTPIMETFAKLAFMNEDKGGKKK